MGVDPRLSKLAVADLRSVRDACDCLVGFGLHGFAVGELAQALAEVLRTAEDGTESGPATKGLPPLGLGDEVQAKLTERLEGVFEPNDKGRVSRAPYVKGSKLMFDVTWYNSGETSERRADSWADGFDLLGKAGHPAVGDELQALPLKRLQDYFEPGDMGRVSQPPSLDKNNNFVFGITWYASGKTSQLLADAWMTGFRLVGRNREPALGDELQALPNEHLADVFEPGDKGRVSCDQYVDTADGKTKFQITWYRTGKTTKRAANNWMKGFKYVESESEYIDDRLKKEMETAVGDKKNTAVGKPVEFISGQPKAAAMGLFHFMRVKDLFMQDSAEKIEKEVREFVAKLKGDAMVIGFHKHSPDHRQDIERIYGTSRVDEAQEELDYFRQVAFLPDDTSALAVAEKVEKETLGNLLYVMYEKASEVFVEGPNSIRDKDRGPVELKDFMDQKIVKDAELTMAHVVALRFYTTPAFKYLNSPLRSQSRYYDRDKPHPMPITMTYISEGIKKLRSAYALKVEQGSATSQLTLWRGLKNMTLPEDFLKNRKGGTELAPMSTTADIAVAARYASSDNSVLFQISLDSFMQYGANLAWLSAFPGEVEVLYPPLTYLQPTGREPQVVQLATGQKFTVHEVKPTIP